MGTIVLGGRKKAVVTRWDSYANLGDVPDVLWAGLPQIRGSTVFVKPNLSVPATRCDKASFTRVEVVRLVIERLKDYGCSDIVVGDCGFEDQWELTIASTGYDTLPRRYGVRLVGLMVGENFHKFTSLRSGNKFSAAKFSDYMLGCDVVINLPKLKVHTMAMVTGAIKNMMGTMEQTQSIHSKDSIDTLHKRLHDLYWLIKDRVVFCLMDGIVGSEYAERCGVPRRANVLISSVDMWEMDVIASQVMGIDPRRIPYLSYVQASVSRSWDELRIDSEFVVPFELPLRWRE